MIKRRPLTLFSSRFGLLNLFRHSRSCFMATPANYLVNQRDFQMLSLRMLSSNSSVSSASDISEGRFLNCFRLKGCCSGNFSKILWNNSGNGNSYGLQKAMAFPHLLCVSEEVVRVEDQEKGSSSSVFNDVRVRHMGSSGSLIGFSEKHLPGKIMVAVDVDEVLGNFVSALNQFIADRYSHSHSISEYHVYEFFKIWNCSRDEADIRVHEFFKTAYFKKGIHPIPGARKALQNLSESCNLSIVTSRQNAIKEHTIEWIEKHYPDLFQEIHFGNHFALDGQSRPKSDICRSLGAKVLIDDNPRYAIECAEVGIKVLLFDYENSYPWCKMENICQHPLVTKVHNWEEVENQLASSIVS
ncbi:uncharacterized protein [Henckelia pumila]|uniref:uncharacterized protein n=1 Tax=Henckelia pumila TaxID=405737 RepID=UPI003C6E7070